MRIGELEKLSGLSRHTLRYYEREGLLFGIQRTPSGYRVYPHDAIKQLRLLGAMKALGFGLDEIKPVLTAVNSSAVNCADGALLLARKRTGVQKQIRQLKGVNRDLLKEQRRLEQRAAEHGVSPTD
ncbi:MAG TPA: MerR family transcriptional regulator [Pseudomonas xinjiangensis]|uniref:MerR family transcriptional regulator n=2 Tax=root TaxID=1 RepID=A0A7V1BS20_9GAMM|nr:MerR family transcriptional regulator [Halopseudomonas xinjiangensis]HEC46335.1 MerR family transcriptional regulator [Halopseudomonas xinjiangensis]